MKVITLKINGKQHELLVGEHDSLVKVLREKALLTGTKRGCEQGSCGACAVLVDGSVLQSCITPAQKCDGSEILTIEGVAKNGQLHDLQRKFVEKGAIQCGYCTPGMVMTSLDLLNDNPNPSDDEIKEALSGNLCRCTGYKKIIEAVSEYATENQST